MNEGVPGVSIVGAGTLDDCRWVAPTLEIYCDSAQSRLRLDRERATLPGSPPGVS